MDLHYDKMQVNLWCCSHQSKGASPQWIFSTQYHHVVENVQIHFKESVLEEKVYICLQKRRHCTHYSHNIIFVQTHICWTLGSRTYTVRFLQPLLPVDMSIGWILKPLQLCAVLFFLISTFLLWNGTYLIHNKSGRETLGLSQLNFVWRGNIY